MKPLSYFLALVLINLAAALAAAGSRLLEWSLPINPGEYRITEIGEKQIVRGVLNE